MSIATSNVKDGVTYKIASTQEERTAAFKLVYQAYLGAGLAHQNQHRMRITGYHLLPTTEIFIAVEAGRVVATLSLVKDRELGLPMESVYLGEVARRRLQDLSLCEAATLAVDDRTKESFFTLLCGLGRLAVQYARRQGLDQLLAAVHPKHARFYQRYMCFEQIGGVRAYPSVDNHPAVALSMDFPEIDRKGIEHPQRYARFFGDPIADDQLAPQPISPEQRAYFRPMLDARLGMVPLGYVGQTAKSGNFLQVPLGVDLGIRTG